MPCSQFASLACWRETEYSRSHHRFCARRRRPECTQAEVWSSAMCRKCQKLAVLFRWQTTPVRPVIQPRLEMGPDRVVPHRVDLSFALAAWHCDLSTIFEVPYSRFPRYRTARRAIGYRGGLSPRCRSHHRGDHSSWSLSVECYLSRQSGQKESPPRPIDP